jgi:hypothetical protein
MEITHAEEIAALLRDCLKELTALEAAFIGDCHLSEPRQSLKAFAEEHGLGQTEMSDLRVRAMKRLREELATMNVHCIADIL